MSSDRDKITETVGRIAIYCDRPSPFHDRNGRTWLVDLEVFRHRHDPRLKLREVERVSDRGARRWREGAPGHDDPSEAGQRRRGLWFVPDSKDGHGKLDQPCPCGDKSLRIRLDRAMPVLNALRANGVEEISSQALRKAVDHTRVGRN